MTPINRKLVGILALAVSGISAIAAPFLLHSPTTQNNNIGPGPDNGNNTNNTTNPTNPTNNPSATPHSREPKKQLQDLKNAVGSCQTTNHGTQQSFMAKLNAAARQSDAAKANHHLAILQHQLETPAADKHAGTCLAELKGLVANMLSS